MFRWCCSHHAGPLEASTNPSPCKQRTQLSKPTALEDLETQMTRIVPWTTRQHEKTIEHVDVASGRGTSRIRLKISCWRLPASTKKTREHVDVEGGWGTSKVNWEISCWRQPASTKKNLGNMSMSQVTTGPSIQRYRWCSRGP